MRIRTGQDGIEHLSLGAGASPAIAAEVLQGLVDEGTYVIPDHDPDGDPGAGPVESARLAGHNPRARALTPPDIWADIRRSIENPRRFGLLRRRPAVCGASTRWGRSCASSTTPASGCWSAPTAGTPLNFHTDATWQEMDLMVSYGISPMEVLAMATRRTAEYLGRGGELGTVTRGKLADLIVVDGNPLLSMRGPAERGDGGEGRPGLHAVNWLHRAAGARAAGAAHALDTGAMQFMPPMAPQGDARRTREARGDDHEETHARDGDASGAGRADADRRRTGPRLPTSTTSCCTPAT